VNRRLHDWRVRCELAVDGDYGDDSEWWSSCGLYGSGLSIAN
jgi:hypothetical protein